VVRREWRVRVAESLGPQKVDVPDTVGANERVAALELRRAGLEVGTTARLPYGRGAQGTVLAQDPPGHAQGIEQPSVNLLVAAPDDEGADGYVMPDMTGWPAVSAEAHWSRWGSRPLPDLCECGCGCRWAAEMHRPEAAGETGHGADAIAGCRIARGSEHDGDTDGGEK
jgi:hypothetical protein